MVDKFFDFFSQATCEAKRTHCIMQRFSRDQPLKIAEIFSRMYFLSMGLGPTLLGANISHLKGTFEDHVPFPQVGYVSSLEGISFNIWVDFD